MPKTAESKPEQKLGVKIGSKEEAFWTRIKENFERRLTDLNDELIFVKATIEMVNKNVEMEHKKFTEAS